MFRGYGARLERDDHEGYPVQYAIEGRWVFNRFESWVIHTYLSVVGFWFDEVWCRVWYPPARRVLHVIGRHHNLACRGSQRCSDDMFRATRS